MKRMKNPSIDVDVDPILGAILGAVIVLGGGAAAYGATRDTEPRTPAPAAAPAADPVVARALKIVSRTDGTVPAADASAAAAEARRAQVASAKGRSVDPFPDAKTPATASSAAPTAATVGTATNVPPAKAQASAASKTSDSANTSVQRATGGTTGAATGAATGGVPSTSTTTKAVTTTDRAAKARGAAASRRRAAAAAARRRATLVPAKVTLRVATQKRRTTMNQRPLGLLVPGATGAVARVIRVSDSNRTVLLRLHEGAALTGDQSAGTRCVQRRSDSSGCLLVRVHTGRTAVIKAPKSASGRGGAVTALRVLSVWRGGAKVAE